MFPDSVWNSAEFWRIMQSLCGRFIYGVYPLDEDVPRLIPEPAGADPCSKAAVRRMNRRFELMSRLCSARLTGDLRTAERLAKRYPTWTAAVELRDHLS